MWNIIEFLLDLEKVKKFGLQVWQCEVLANGFSWFLRKILKILIMFGQIHT